MANFDENSPKNIITSPRSIQACKTEGVLPQELYFKPIEAFQEKNLEPRLVKLRFDFFEAKRRDLLAAARRARDNLLDNDRHEKENTNQLEIVGRDGTVQTSACIALKFEREKMERAQKHERNWLRNALNIELKQLQTMESNNVMLNQEAQGDEEKQRQAAIKLKELNDRRQQEDERKQLEIEARAKLEKQIAKEEFHKQQEELRKRGELEARKQQEVYERQMREVERKKEAENEKQQKREQAAREQEAKKAELRAQDLRRMDVLEQKKESFQISMIERKEARDSRIYQSIQIGLELEQKKRDEFEERQRIEQQREERLMQMKALEQEESAKRSFQTMMRRKVIQEEAQRKSEEKRLAILEQQEETEMRLLDHEQKKERYLDFKRELDGLRGKNKEINVERQRRREEAGRESVADAVRKKDEKIDELNRERRRLWELRRTAQSEAYRARELVKAEIMRQRVASKFDSKLLENKLNSLLGGIGMDSISPKLQGSASMPSMKSKQSMSDGNTLSQQLSQSTVEAA